MRLQELEKRTQHRGKYQAEKTEKGLETTKM